LLGGLNGSAVYIYTEGEPALDRLKELAAMLPYRLDPTTSTPSFAINVDFMNNIFLETGFDDGTQLLARLHRLRPSLERRGPRRVRLLIVDSIAWLFRDLLGDKNDPKKRDPESDNNNTSQISGDSSEKPNLVGAPPSINSLSDRTELLFQISSLLRMYADEFNLVVMVTNQIMDAVNGNGASSGHTGALLLHSSGREVIPALGLAWANCVNTRVFLSKETIGARGATKIVERGPPGAGMQRAIAAGMASLPQFAPQLRHMQIVFSPTLPPGKCAYVVEKTGVRGIHPNAVHAAPEDQN
jgi:DNA-repair protein XRCC3